MLPPAPRLLAVALAALAGCTSGTSHGSRGERVPAAVAPIGVPSQPSRTADTARVSGSVRFVTQPGWVEETPTSSMRKVQYLLPGAKAVADATLVVFHFGPGGGGGVEANLERWAGQFEQPDGSDSRAAMTSRTRAQNGVAVTDVDLAGTYVAETSPGSGERVHHEGWRMLASIVEAPEGPYYVKLVGPAATVARWEESFRAFVASVVP